MAQPITCDVHGNEHIADVLVSQLANGSTFAACADGYLEMCRAVVAGAGPSEADIADADALARLDAAGAGSSFPTSPSSSDAGEAPAEPPTSAVDDPGSLQSAPGPAPSLTSPDGASSVATEAEGEPVG